MNELDKLALKIIQLNSANKRKDIAINELNREIDNWISISKELQKSNEELRNSLFLI